MKVRLYNKAVTWNITPCIRYYPPKWWRCHILLFGWLWYYIEFVWGEK